MRNPSSVTSREVARLAGVSQPTVSRALRDEAGVAEETKRRVREAAALLGYVPSQNGRSLVTRRTKRIGIVAAELSNPFYPALVAPLSDALERNGYRTILITDRGASTVDVEPLLDGSVDGVLLTTSELASPLPAELRRRRIPFVQVGREVAGVDADACVVDNAAGAAAAADLLIDLGHHQIAAIFGPQTTSTGRDRAAAFLERAATRDVLIAPERRLYGPFEYAEGATGLNTLMSQKTAPTAIFCANDVLALGACNAAYAAGISIPRDLSIVGFDDIEMASWAVFRLTTVSEDLRQLAAVACELLLERIAGSDEPPKRIVLPVEITERSTHGPPQEPPGRDAAAI